ncbi:MAG: LuxR C-terminal-related transcriptional regulator [Candidatus Binatia bacterium]
MLIHEQFTNRGEPQNDTAECISVLPQGMKPGPQILLASPETQTRRCWKQSLQEYPYRIAEVGGATALERRLRKLQPEMLFLDLSLPTFGKREGIAKIHRLSPQTKVIMFPHIANEREGVALLGAGAHGYCQQDLDEVLLRRMVEVVQRGEVWVGRQLVSSLLDEFQSAVRALQEETTQHSASSGLALLTSREYAIGQHVRRGESNRSIAEHFGIAERTVKAHVTSAFRKLGVRDRVQLALRLAKLDEQEKREPLPSVC